VQYKSPRPTKQPLQPSRSLCRNSAIVTNFSLTNTITLKFLFTSLITYLPTYLLTYSIGQNPTWEVNRFSASKKIPSILWNRSVQYRFYKNPPPVPILSQINPDHAPTSHILKIHLHIILPSTPESSKWSLSLRFTNLNAVCPDPLRHSYYMPRQSRSSLFDHKKKVGEEYRSLSSSLRSFLHSPVISFLLGPNILLSTLFNRT